MISPLPHDYGERVYAGVLGKLIGVYLGRPFEQWSYEAITERWGEIRRYVHEDQKVDLIVPDDDITGTFTFIRALLDHGIRADITSKEIGQTWLNYIAEGRHILWWGGMGLSTEHTAWLRLRDGIEAPRSGSIELNGAAVGEEIGAQIFIDGWAMVSPGQPDLAVRLAGEAARVSHDGEAVHGAKVIAAMEALAFVEGDIEALLDRAISYIPADSRVARMIADVRLWRKEGFDWRTTRERLVARHGYQIFETNCPLVSNLGVIILALLYGEGDFDRSMTIVCTCGYDTDCNAGNLGCLLGIRNGLETFRSGYDWRTPVNDRLYLPAADGHWGMQDAANVALELANIGRVLAGEKRETPKGGAKYHFSLPGSTHGFAPSSLCSKGALVSAAVGALEKDQGTLQLEVRVSGERCDAVVSTFLSPGGKSTGYAAAATPALYAGEEIAARVVAASSNQNAVRARLFARDQFQDESEGLREGSWLDLKAGKEGLLRWTVPPNGGWPISEAGVLLDGPAGSRLHLDSLTWSGTPSISFEVPAEAEARKLWEKMFVGSMDQGSLEKEIGFRLIQNRGRGVIHTGSRGWHNYRVGARIKPFLAREFGLAARVQGLTRYYGLLFRGRDRLALVRMAHDETLLAEIEFPWEIRREYAMRLEVRGNRLRGTIDERLLIEAEDLEEGLDGGGIGFVLSEGMIQAKELRMESLP
jgi:ADP-ribosylglycohydrolase